MKLKPVERELFPELVDQTSTGMSLAGKSLLKMELPTVQMGGSEGLEMANGPEFAQP